MPISDLNSIIKQFEYYKSLGEKTFSQIKDETLFFQYNEESNSIAVIVNHISGNMRSRWTDFLTADGEKEWRNRDQEFESLINSREELIQKWNEGWTCLFTALNSVTEENFDTIVYIRNQAHSIMDASLRQLAHYAYHIGQIVYVGRMQSENWSSLSIPKGDSANFNKDKFAKGKHGGHFTDDIK
ncbi:DUF1572 family protein [Roseivirga sp.]|uniref:DUF1572 family protein n=1 Tax=Roseivirga sp. TaxID=1964215 RepID=UPI003B8D4CF2